MDRQAVVGAKPAHVADAADHRQSSRTAFIRMGFIAPNRRQFGSDPKNQHLPAVLTTKLQDGVHPDLNSLYLIWRNWIQQHPPGCQVTTGFTALVSMEM